MHKNLFIFLFCVCFVSITFAQNTIVDSIVVKNCLNDDDDGIYLITTVDSFNSDDQILGTISMDSLYNPRFYDDYDYSPSGKLLYHEYGEFIGTTQSSISTESYTYDSLGSLTSYTFNRQFSSYSYQYTYNQSTHQKITIYSFPPNSPITRTTETYDSLGKLLTKDIERYSNSLWSIDERNWYNYLPNDSINYILTKTYSNSDSLIYSYVYDSLYYSTVIELYLWDSADSAFSDTIDRAVANYDSLHRIIFWSDDWYVGNGGWATDATASWFYDSQGNLIREETTFDPHGGSWTDYIYDHSTGLIDSLNTCRWATHSGSCKFCKYSYSNFPLGILAADEATSFLLYPNPVKKDLKILISEKSQTEILVSVVNIFSSTMFKSRFKNENQFFELHLPELANGIYFVRLECDGKISSRKIIVEN